MRGVAFLRERADGLDVYKRQPDGSAARLFLESIC